MGVFAPPPTQGPSPEVMLAGIGAIIRTPHDGVFLLARPCTYRFIYGEGRGGNWLGLITQPEGVRWRQEVVKWCWEGVLWYREGVRWCLEGVRLCREGVRWCREGVW